MEFPYMNWESVSRFWTWKFRNGFIFVPLSYLSFIVVVQIPVSVILSVLTQRVSNIGPRNSLNVLLVLLSRDFIRKIINPGLSEIILGKPKMSQCPGLPRQVLLTICSLLNLPHYPHLLPLASHNPAWCICSVTQSRRLLETPWTIAHKALLSMGFFRQGYWRELPFPLPEDIPDPGIKPASPALAGIFFTTEPLGGPQPNIENPPSPFPLLVSVILASLDSMLFFTTSPPHSLSSLSNSPSPGLLGSSWASYYMASPATPFGKAVYPILPSVPRDSMMWSAYFSFLKWFPDLSLEFLDKDLNSGLMKSTFTSLCLHLITVFYPHVKEFRSPYILSFTAPATTIVLSDSTSGRRIHENYSPPGPWPA